MVLIHTLINLQKIGVTRDFLVRANTLTSCIQNKTRVGGCVRSLRSSTTRSSRGKWPEVKTKLEPAENPFHGVIVETGTVNSGSLLKPYLFTVAFTTASFTGAAIWEYENIRSKTINMLTPPAQWFQERLRIQKYGKWRNELNKWWNGLTEWQRVFIPICAANILVFLAWRVPMFQQSMVKYFCSNPASSAPCWPMFLSTFSHYSTFHLLANMYVLFGFSIGSVTNMGKEQFVGFYMAAGVIASFASYLHKVMVNRPGLSLGASGAIMGVLGFACSKFPDLELSIIFLPFFTFKAAAAIKAIMAMDALGVILGWKFFDHAAHLGGAIFGMFWSYWGSQHIWHNREPLLQLWHNVRGPVH